MKIRNTILFAMMAVLGLASCEMKEELWGNENNPDEVGLLNVGVAVSSLVNDVPVVTRANSEDIPVTSPISAEGYIIELLNADGTTAKSFTYESDMEPVEVPTGDYTLYAHMDKTFDEEMTEPYYGGRESVSIKKGITTEASVTCKMENTKIQINYPDTFLKTFKTWTILITDNNGHTVTFTHENINPDAIYWKIGENVKSITINVTATTAKGERVSDSRNVLKPEESDSEYWLGNDALTITVEPGDKKPVDNPNQPAEPDEPDTDEPEDPDPTPEPEPEPEPDDSSTVSGIEIKVEGIFGDAATDVTVTVPTTPSEEVEEPEEPEQSEPEQPSEEEGTDSGESGENSTVPTLSGEYLKKTAQIDKAGTVPNIEVVMTVPNGIDKVEVKATTSDTELSSILDGMGFMSEDGLNLVTANDLSKLFPLPVQGENSYTFVLGGLASYLTVGEHSFTVKVTDKNGDSASGTLKIEVTDSSAK